MSRITISDVGWRRSHDAPLATRRAVLSALVLLGSGCVASAAPGNDGQTKSAVEQIVYRNAKFGFSLRIPEDVFAPSTTPNAEGGGMWVSRDGQARLVAAAQPNETQESLQSYRKFLMTQTYENATFDYTPMRDNWFVLSGTKDGRMFYERVTFACDGRYIYGWQLQYPVAERQRYDRVVEAVHRNYKVGKGVDERCN